MILGLSRNTIIGVLAGLVAGCIAGTSAIDAGADDVGQLARRAAAVLAGGNDSNSISGADLGQSLANCLSQAGGSSFTSALKACSQKTPSDQSTCIAQAGAPYLGGCVESGMARALPAAQADADSFFQAIPSEIASKHFPVGQQMNWSALSQAIIAAAGDTNAKHPSDERPGAAANAFLRSARGYLFYKGLCTAARSSCEKQNLIYPSSEYLPPETKNPSINGLSVTVGQPRPSRPVRPVGLIRRTRLPPGEIALPINSRTGQMTHSSKCQGDCKPDLAGCVTEGDPGLMYSNLGISQYCMHKALRQEAEKIPAGGANSCQPIATANLVLAPVWPELVNRYEGMRAQFVQRTASTALMQIAKNLNQCEQIESRINEWANKIGKCGLPNVSLPSKQSLMRICQAKPDQAEQQKQITEDARYLAGKRMEVEYLQQYPTDGGTDDSQKQRERVERARKTLQNRYPKGEMGTAPTYEVFSNVDRETNGFPITAQMKQQKIEDAEQVLACYETVSPPSIRGKSTANLLEISQGKKRPQTYEQSESYKELNGLFQRVCTEDSNDSLNFYELERLLGRPKSGATLLDSVSGNVSRCMREFSPEKSIENSLQTVENVCAVGGTAMGIAAVNPALAAPAAIANVACIAPSVSLAVLRSKEKSKLAMYRRALGSALSCEQTNDLVKAQAVLDDQINSDILNSALQAGFSVGDIIQIIREFKAARQIEQAIKEKITKLRGGVSSTSEPIAKAEQASTLAAPQAPKGAHPGAPQGTPPPPPPCTGGACHVIYPADVNSAMIKRQTAIESFRKEQQSLTDGIYLATSPVSEQNLMRDLRATLAQHPDLKNAKVLKYPDGSIRIESPGIAPQIIPNAQGMSKADFATAVHAALTKIDTEISQTSSRLYQARTTFRDASGKYRATAKRLQELGQQRTAHLPQIKRVEAEILELETQLKTPGLSNEAREALNTKVWAKRKELMSLDGDFRMTSNEMQTAVNDITNAHHQLLGSAEASLNHRGLRKGVDYEIVKNPEHGQSYIRFKTDGRSRLSRYTNSICGNKPVCDIEVIYDPYAGHVTNNIDGAMVIPLKNGRQQHQVHIEAILSDASPDSFLVHETHHLWMNKNIADGKPSLMAARISAVSNDPGDVLSHNIHPVYQRQLSCDEPGAFIKGANLNAENLNGLAKAMRTPKSAQALLEHQTNLARLLNDLSYQLGTAREVTAVTSTTAQRFRTTPSARQMWITPGTKNGKITSYGVVMQQDGRAMELTFSAKDMQSKYGLLLGDALSPDKAHVRLPDRSIASVVENNGTLAVSPNYSTSQTTAIENLFKARAEAMERETAPLLKDLDQTLARIKSLEQRIGSTPDSGGLTVLKPDSIREITAEMERLRGSVKELLAKTVRMSKPLP